jgi:hypothetical protein
MAQALPAIQPCGAHTVPFLPSKSVQFQGFTSTPSQAVGTVGEVGPVGALDDWDEGEICRGRGCWPFARRGGDYDAGGRRSGLSYPSRDAHRRSAGRDTAALRAAGGRTRRNRPLAAGWHRTGRSLRANLRGGWHRHVCAGPGDTLPGWRGSIHLQKLLTWQALRDRLGSDRLTTWTCDDRPPLPAPPSAARTGRGGVVQGELGEPG